MDPNDSSAAGDATSDDSSVANRDALSPGVRLGDFEIVRTIGSGGFGVVYLALDRCLDREVAIKEFLPSHMAYRLPGQRELSLRTASFAESFGAGLRSFVNEAKILARFNHPGIVKVHRFWEANGTAYMVMPYVRGPTLRDVRRSMKSSPTEAWLRGVLDPLLDALATLHGEGIYHRDIAPDNILLPGPHEPVLLDFGAARRVIGDRTQTFTAVLKPNYAPIEQYAEATELRQGPWTDLYALGAVMVYMLHATPPPPSTVRSMHDDMPLLLQDPPAGVSASFLSAMQWALAVRPKDRPQSVQQFRNALDGRILPPPIARRANLLDDEEEPYGSAPSALPGGLVQHLKRPDTEPPQLTTVAYAMHSDVPTFETPELSTWDTTIHLSSTTPAAQAQEPAADRQVNSAESLSTVARARFARLRQEAVALPRSTMVAAAGVAALLACVAVFGLLYSRPSEQNVATWHELAQNAKPYESIIDERAEDSRPYTGGREAAAAPASSEGGAVRVASVTTESATSSGTSGAGLPTMLANSIAPGEPAVINAVSSDKQIKRTTRPKTVKLTRADPREACRDRNFLSAAVCMNRRCDEVKYKNHPQCVALVRQREGVMRRDRY